MLLRTALCQLSSFRATWVHRAVMIFICQFVNELHTTAVLTFLVKVLVN